MAFPAGVVTRPVVVGPILGPLGVPAVGNVIYTASMTVIHGPSRSTILAAPVPVPLVAGVATVELPVSRQANLINGTGGVIENFTYGIEWQISTPTPPKSSRFELLAGPSPEYILPDVPASGPVTTIARVDYEGILAGSADNATRSEQARVAVEAAAAAIPAQIDQHIASNIPPVLALSISAPIPVGTPTNALIVRI